MVVIVPVTFPLERTMRNHAVVLALVLLNIVMFGCADPAANKTKAKVGTAAPESTAAKTGGETLSISPENSKVEFVAAKVTRSHNGSFKQFSGSIDLVNNSIEQ